MLAIDARELHLRERPRAHDDAAHERDAAERARRRGVGEEIRLPVTIRPIKRTR